METDTEAFDWTVRNAIYATIREHGMAPTVTETAATLGLTPDTVRAAFERLHEGHALFLSPVSRDIRMAHPFSCVPTPFRVESGNRAYWANCAWDSLGIPAALHADARISARIGDDGEPVQFFIAGGRVQGWDGVVHFPLPFQRWYDDLIET